MITPTDQFFEAIKKCLKEVLREELSSLQKEKQEFHNTSPVFLSRKEAAKFLKISLSTLHNRTKAGVYNALKTGDTVLYDQDDLIKQIKSNQYRII